MTAGLYVAEHIDMTAEKKRMGRDIEKVDAEIKKGAARLANRQVIAKTPGEIVEEWRERQAEWEAKGRHLKAALSRIEAE